MTASDVQPNPFSGLVMDRAGEHLEDPAWLAACEVAPASRFILLDAEYRVPVHVASGRLHSIDAATRARWVPDWPASLLGTANGHAWFLLHTPTGVDVPTALRGDGIEWFGLRQAGATLDPFAAGLFAYARGLAYWQDMTRFCPVCGAPLERISAGRRARCTAPGCGRLQFPRTDPAIIVIVERNGACLLGRQASWAAARYSTLAGFVEPGETLEGAVRREVLEEAGIEVGACRYHSSQPWPFPASLMVGFMATALNDDIVLRDGELEEAHWFTPEAIVAAIGEGSFVPSSQVSVSWHLLADWMRERADMDLAAVVAAQR